MFAFHVHATQFRNAGKKKKKKKKDASSYTLLQLCALGNYLSCLQGSPLVPTNCNRKLCFMLLCNSSSKLTSFSDQISDLIKETFELDDNMLHVSLMKWHCCKPLCCIMTQKACQDVKSVQKLISIKINKWVSGFGCGKMA